MTSTVLLRNYDTDNRDMCETVVSPKGGFDVVVDPTHLYINALQNHSETPEMEQFAESIVFALNDYFGEVLEHEDQDVELGPLARFKDFIFYLRTVKGLDNDGQ